MSFTRGDGVAKLKADLERARAGGGKELMKQLKDRVGDSGVSRPGEYPGKDTGELAASFL